MKSINRQSRAAWAMSAPALIVLTIFLIVPFVTAFILSFTNRTLIMGPTQSLKFTGLRNYIRLFSDEDFFFSLRNTLKFVIIVAPVQSALALGLAMMINKRSPGINIFRGIFFSPVVITMTVVAIVWALILDPSQNGFMNTFLNAITFGLFKGSKWLHAPESAMNSIIIISIWQGVGFQMIIFLSGLQYIPGTLYEAADIDGANKFQQFINVTIPQLKNTTVFVIISTTIAAFKLFTQVMVLTEGGPRKSTTTLIYMMYQEGFRNMKIGYASALAVVFFIFVLLISLVQRKLMAIGEE